MDKNLLLAVSLSILIYAGWFGFIEKRMQPPVKATATATATTATPATTMNGAANANRMGTAETKTQSGFADSAPVAASADKTESASFDQANLVIRSHGAAAVSWQYQGPRGLIQLVKDPEPGILSTFPELEFKRSGPGLTFTAVRRDGLRVVKEFVQGADGKLPVMRITLENPTSKTVESGDWAVSVGPGLGTIPSELAENEKETRSLGLTRGTKGLNGKIEVFKPAEDHPAGYLWVGVDNRYFLAAMLPAEEDFAKTETLPNHQVRLVAKSAAIPAKGKKTWDLPFYVGAKGHTWLSRYRMGLERSIDFGFFAQLGRLVLKVLGKLHTVTGNWGWSIILLTLLLQVLLFPLTYKSLKATAAMRKLQPEIARLQQRYGKDPAKLNTEMMQLYKKHGANPLGGCLPMLIQMPVFVALFKALRNAWELHGAAWMFWIKDLSAKDPYYVLPVVMGGLMFAQNRMTPAAGVDPAQQKMMQFMPLIFTFMFMKFPSGLVLYWMTNSLVSTLQQLALRNRLGLGSQPRP